MPAGNDLPSEALDDIAYLSRSANRVRILDALAAGDYSRGELAELTGTSRTTLDRIVNELEERSWAARTAEGTYAATPQGTALVRRLRPFVASVETINRLGEAVAWLPLDEWPIGLEHFSDAVVWRPESADPVETIEFMADLLRDASRFRVLSHLAPPDSVGEALAAGVTSGRLTADGVTTDALVAYLGSREQRVDRWRSMIRAGAEFYRHEGPIPCNLWIIDDTVLIKQSGPGPIEESYGEPIISQDEAVRGWAHDLIDAWTAKSTRIDVEAFVADPTVSE